MERREQDDRAGKAVARSGCSASADSPAPLDVVACLEGTEASWSPPRAQLGAHQDLGDSACLGHVKFQETTTKSDGPGRVKC